MIPQRDHLNCSHYGITCQQRRYLGQPGREGRGRATLPRRASPVRSAESWDDYSFPEGFGPHPPVPRGPHSSADRLCPAGTGSHLHPDLEVDAVASSCSRNVSNAREAHTEHYRLAGRRHPPVDREQERRRLIDRRIRLLRRLNFGARSRHRLGSCRSLNCSRSALQPAALVAMQAASADRECHLACQKLYYASH